MSKDKGLSAVFDPIGALKEMGIRGIPEPVDLTEKEEEEQVLDLTECADCEDGTIRQVKGIAPTVDGNSDFVITLGHGTTINGTVGPGLVTDNYAEERAAYEAGDTSKGMRFNSGKPRYDLVPPEGFAELVEVYTMGAKKYADRNWEKGISMSDCFASMMRHAWSWMRGEDLDPESGLHHMGHVAWNAIAIVTFYRRNRKDIDDRPAV